MKELKFNREDNLAFIIESLQQETAGEIKLTVPPENEFWQSPLNRQLLKRWAQGQNKKLFWDSLTMTEKDVSSSVVSSPTPSSLKKKKNVFNWPRGGIFLFFIFLALIFALAALGFIYYYLPRATVTLLVQESTITRQEKVTVDPQIATLDYDNLKVPGESVAIKNTAQGTFKATGKVEGGTKAEGEVTIYNKTKVAVKLKKGTTLGSQGEKSGLTFLLQEEVTVPPVEIKPLSEGEQSIWGKKENLRVIAAEIGPQYNLEAETVFQVNDFDPNQQLYATNPLSFRGGTVTEELVVSRADQQQAVEELANQVYAQNKEDIKTKLVGDQQLLEEFINNQVLNREFSVGEGAKADSFQATVTGQSQATLFSRSQVKKLLLTVLKENLPAGFQLLEDKTTLSLEGIDSNSEGQLVLMATIQGIVIPEIDSDDLRQKLQGLKPAQAEAFLVKLENINGYRINLWPRMPSFLQTLPYRQERIRIRIKVKNN